MMTLAELQASKINPGVAREAYEQSSKRLEDALATKAGHEQKAFALLGGFVVIALALFSAGAGILSDDKVPVVLARPFVVAGVVYVFGASMLLWGSRISRTTYTAALTEVWRRTRLRQ
jgi:hypothetical protein